MRKLNFRAWTGEKMINTGTLHETVRDTWEMWDGETHEYYPVMQSTNLHDKNGKEIYEGDVCTQTFGNNPQERGAVTIEVTRGVMVGNKPVWHHNVEVIGNIYENPELLTKKDV